jgi:hypothetical protein
MDPQHSHFSIDDLTARMRRDPCRPESPDEPLKKHCTGSPLPCNQWPREKTGTEGKN